MQNKQPDAVNETGSVKVKLRHAEISVGKSIALVELKDLEKVKNYNWQPHPRGPICVETLDAKTRKRKYTLMAKLIYGRACSFISGNRNDLRICNVIFKQMRSGPIVKQRAGGVYFVAKHNEWVAQIKISGKRITRRFSCRKHGSVQAKELASLARLRMEKVAEFQRKKLATALRRRPRFMRRNMLSTVPEANSMALLNLARMYAKKNDLPDTMAPHLHRMILLGGGRMPDSLRNRKNAAVVNIYEGNQEYENSVAEIPISDDGKWNGYQMAHV